MPGVVQSDAHSEKSASVAATRVVLLVKPRMLVRTFGAVAHVVGVNSWVGGARSMILSTTANDVPSRS